MSPSLFLSAVGVDIAKASFDAARLSADGKYKHKKFDNTPEGFALFAAWLASFGSDAPHVCMESTGPYSLPLADYLIGQGFHVSVVNPAKIAAFAKSELSRAKTDKADAKLIARYALAMRPSAWMPPPPEIRELQALLRRVEHLLEMQRMEQNRQDTTDATIADSIKAVLATLAKELEATRNQIRRHIDNHPDLKRRADLLESIPGVGKATAAWLLTLLSEHHGFTDAKQAVAFAGLAPRLRQSGRWAGQTHSPRPETDYCARPFTCLSWRPRSSILLFAPSPSASRPTASTAWPSTAPPCASSSTSPLPFSNPASRSTLNLNLRDRRKKPKIGIDGGRLRRYLLVLQHDAFTLLEQNVEIGGFHAPASFGIFSANRP